DCRQRLPPRCRPGRPARPPDELPDRPRRRRRRRGGERVLKASMHELSLASVIAQKVQALAEGQPLARVREVRVAVGEWTSVQAEQLVFCYRAVTEDTPLGDSILAIEPVAGVVKCPYCGY